jgi:hypothetical protein
MAYEVQLGGNEIIDVRVENVPSARRWDEGEQVVIDFHPESALALTE